MQERATSASGLPGDRWPAWYVMALGAALWVLAVVAGLGTAALGAAVERWAEDAAGVDVALPGFIVGGAVMLMALVALAGLVAGTVALAIGTIRWSQVGPWSRQGPLQWQQELGRRLDAIHERLTVSETAKRIAYREQDLALLRRTIDEDIERGQFDAALVLVGELAQTYGDREQAEHYRERIEQVRAAQRDARVGAALKNVEELIERRHFEAAQGELVKLARVHGELPAVRQAGEKVEAERRRYKHELEQQFLDAAERGDTDAAMELLWALDHYLTETEAEPLRELARGVIGKRRDNLGVQFKKAVRDRDWQTAVRVGEQIIEDFPNTRMAGEVREHLDVLRERAAQQRAAQGAMQSAE